MKDTKFFEQALELVAPWKVVDVNMDLAAKRVEVKVPWANKHSQWTMLFERLALEVLQACRSLSQACNLLDLDWRSAHRIMRGAVQRGLDARQLEGLRRVGLDEKSFGLGQDYVSVLTDLDQSRVLEVVPGNDTQSGCALWQSV